MSESLSTVPQVGIPVIDLGPYLDGSDPDAVVRAVKAACEDTGFFVIVNHAVDPSLIAAARHDARAFFNRPVEEKLAIDSGAGFAGYSGLSMERLAYSLGDETPPDLKESWTSGRVPEDMSDDEYFTGAEGSFYFPANKYPTAPDSFTASATAYYRRMGALQETVMGIFALALDLPADYFTPLLDKHFSYLRYVYYPAPTEPPLPGQLRAGTHSDYGSLTFVSIEDKPGGLQVLGRDGEWIDVPFVPGGFVVNLGDLMADWTNGVWKSTLHRVVVPEESDWAGSDRLSLVFFGEPNWDARIEAIPSCVSADNPVRQAPVLAGEHLKRKVLAQMDLGDS